MRICRRNFRQPIDPSMTTVSKSYRRYRPSADHVHRDREVDVDHQILRRTGIRNLEKKFESIARVAEDEQVKPLAASGSNVQFDLFAHCSSTKRHGVTGPSLGTRTER